MLRKHEKMPFTKIRTRVKNLKGMRPSWKTCSRIFARFNPKKGFAQYSYDKCGRKPWKLTKQAKKFLEATMLTTRKAGACTSTTLQAALTKESGIMVETSCIRKFLKSRGYKWLPRGQKKKYSIDDEKERLAFAKQVVSMTAPKLREKLSFAMDGVVLGMPPKDPTRRLNHCHASETHMWRKPSERALRELAGDDPFPKQCALEQSVPLWAGVSAGGVAAVVYHAQKKLTGEEWAAAVAGGKLRAAICRLNPVKPKGPWHVLCDNESFLRAPASKEAHEKAAVTLWKIPPRSPD
jgi:transposase